MEKAVGLELVKELESGVALLVYDIPYPPKGCDAKKFRPWFSWYDWAASKLRALGYPIQYSVILIAESKMAHVRKLVDLIDDKRQALNRVFGLNIPRASVNVIRFKAKTRDDTEALLGLIRQGLKATLQAFVEDIEAQIRSGKDKTSMQRRVRDFMKKLKNQDFLNLLLKDPELRSLMLQLEILTA